jgi:hypothetical protein
MMDYRLCKPYAGHKESKMKHLLGSWKSYNLFYLYNYGTIYTHSECDDEALEAAWLSVSRLDEGTPDILMTEK